MFSKEERPCPKSGKSPIFDHKGLAGTYFQMMRKLPDRSDLVSRLREWKEQVWTGPFRDTRSVRFARRFAAKSYGMIREGAQALGQEAEQTEQMARSFFRMLEARLDLSGRTTPPSEEEVRAAIEQLKDVGRFSLFTTLVILPGGVVSLVGLELLARKFGIRGFNLIPDSFRKKKGPHLPARR